MAGASLNAILEAKYPDLHTELVLYCGGGFRSALAADNLQKMGYKCHLHGRWNPRLARKGLSAGEEAVNQRRANQKNISKRLLVCIPPASLKKYS